MQYPCIKTMSNSKHDDIIRYLIVNFNKSKTEQKA